jgi:hypothetical protein
MRFSFGNIINGGSTDCTCEPLLGLFSLLVVGYDDVERDSLVVVCSLSLLLLLFYIGVIIIYWLLASIQLTLD